MATVSTSAAELFRTNLAAAMHGAGISQYALAEAADVDRSYLIRLLQGKQTPTLEMAEKLSAAVGKPLWKLLR